MALHADTRIDRGVAAVKVRPVAESDCWMLYSWSSDSITRLNSFQRRRIAEQEHFTWFYRRLRDENARGYMLELDKQPLAVVWYVKYNDSAEVSVTVAPEQRGHGYAEIALRESVKLVRVELRIERVRALVFADNLASLKSFERAGYVRQGRPCCVLELDCRGAATKAA